MVVIDEMFLKMLLCLLALLAFVLALPAANAMCYVAFEVPDEHGESMLKAFARPFWLLLYGDDESY